MGERQPGSGHDRARCDHRRRRHLRLDRADTGCVYEGLLCVNSNDPDTPLVEVPVALTVDSMPFLDGFETGDASRWSVSVGLP